MKKDWLETIRTFYENLLYRCYWLFALMIVWAAVNLFVRQIVPAYCYLISAVITFALLKLYAFIKKKWSKTGMISEKLFLLVNRIADSRLIFLLIVVIPLLIEFLIIAIWDMPTTGDIGVYICNAAELAEKGMVSTNAEYSLRFPHLFWTGVILSPLCKIGTSYKVFQVAFALMGGMTTWLLYQTMLCSTSKTTAFITSAIYSYMPSTLFACMTITHEIIFRFLFVCIIWMIAKTNKEKTPKIFIWCVIGGLVACAIQINQMARVLCISLVIMVIFSHQRNWRQKIFRLFLIFFPIFIIGQIAPLIQKNHTEGHREVAEKSYAWAIYVGGNEQENGRYNEADRQNVLDYIAEENQDYDTSDFENAAWTLAKARWAELARTPFRFGVHLLKKYMIVWSGSHYSLEYTGVYQHGIKKLAIMLLMAVNNLIYLVLGVIGWEWFRKNGKKVIQKSPLFCFSCTMIIGVVCVLLIVEVMNKYNLSAIVPLYIIWGYSLTDKGIGGIDKQKSEEGEKNIEE